MTLIRRGIIPPDESVVVCITGNGYKTAAETIGPRLPAGIEIGRSLADFDAYMQSAPEHAPALPRA
jgi:threonine synthase